VRVAQLDHQVDRPAIDVGERRGRIAELVAPVRAGPPSRAFKNETEAMRGRDREIAAIIRKQRVAAMLAVDQIEGREIGQLMTLEKDERGLEPAVGEEQAALALRQFGAMPGHGALSM